MSGSGLNLPAAAVRAPQIVAAALTAGCVMLLCVALAVVGPPVEAKGVPLITAIVSLVAAVMVCARFVLPAIFTAQTRRKILQDNNQMEPAAMPDAPPTSNNVQKLLQAALTRTILSAALLESAVLLMLVAYFIERSPLSLAVAVVTIVMLAAGIPTASGLTGWVEHQMRLLDQQRQFQN